ncbi:MAG: hypothetical protein M1570_12560 [Chloroflexi bacterium]|nr:hypothetical protein [Chloroflexota bacterium]
MFERSRPLHIVLALLVAFSTGCRPASAPPTPVATAPVSPTLVAPTPVGQVVVPKALEIIRKDVSTENLAAYAGVLALSHQETSDLLDMLAADGYTSFVERGEFSYSNGGALRAVSITNGGSLVVLAQMQTGQGAVDAMIFEFRDKRTLLIRDQRSSIEITTTENGEIRYSAKDVAGNLTTWTGDVSLSRSKLASLPAQTGSSCTSGMADEYIACMPPGDFLDSLLCQGALIAAAATCTVPPWIDCAVLIAGVLVTCYGSVAACMWEMVDDPPTFEYSQSVAIESYSYCRDNDLVIEPLFQVQVDCKDDRIPAPNDLTVRLSTGGAKEFTCTDCSGQTCSGTVPSPIGESVVKCEFGCQSVGNGQDRCLAQGETRQDAPALQPSAPSGIPAGTYKGTTSLKNLFDDKGWQSAETVNLITVNVAEDGTVTGSMSFIHIKKKVVSRMNPQTRQSYNCTLAQRATWEATISGRLTEATGEIGLKTNTTTSQGYEDCPAELVSNKGEFDFRVNVTVAGETMQGNGGVQGFTFTATKK